MKRVYLDILERVVWTALQAGVGAWVALGDFSDTTLKVAGVAAVTAAAKCILATRVGDSDSAAALPGVDGP